MIDWQGNDQLNLEAGQYQFVVTDASNCSETIPVLVSGPSAINASFNSNSTPFNPSVNGGTPPYTYQWLYYGSIVATGNSYNPSESGLYTLVVTDASNCEGRSTAQNYTQQTVSINHSIQNTVNIFPNPMTSKLFVQIQGNNNEELNLKLIDSKGSLVFETIFKNETIIERDNFSKGIYSLIITGGDTQIVEKIIISDFNE